MWSRGFINLFLVKNRKEFRRRRQGTFGKAYRGRGDEVQVLLPGVDAARAAEFAEKILKAVREARHEHEGAALPKVTASLGLASSPPDERGLSLEDKADERQFQAKREGKDRAVGPRRS